jgi:O-antigen/teichoic acid export membrane protein
MERRGCGLGVSIAGLGLILSCCLLPYVISSAYSMAAALFQMQAAPKWLWGDWLNTTLGASEPLYMFLAEGPICIAGIVGFLIIVVGIFLAMGGLEEEDEYYAEEETL